MLSTRYYEQHLEYGYARQIPVLYSFTMGSNPNVWFRNQFGKATAERADSHAAATRTRFLIFEQLDSIAEVAVHVEPFHAQEPAP